MSSGFKAMVINTQERAVSTDINRLQSFLSAGNTTLLQYLFGLMNSGAFVRDDLDAGAVGSLPNSLNSPLTADVIGGLLVQPQGGSLNLLVTPGVLLSVTPDSGPDDSNYKFVSDPGVTVVGTLVAAANPSGFARVDVVEVQVSNVITEQQSRDIFNTGTGLFSATLVTKAVQDTCAFVGGATNVRVRLGTPGAGFPGTASGWLPLCVVSAPSGATSVDQMTFWDVRPLVSDREFQPFSLQTTYPRFNYQHYIGYTTPVTGAANYKFAGMVEAAFGGYRYGGELRRGTPGTDENKVDIADAANLASGYALSPGTNAFVYLAAPFGLPRWARYTDGPSGRQPRSPRGLLITCGVAPNADGFPSGAINMPTSTGLGGSTTNALCMWMQTAKTIGGFTNFSPTFAEKSFQRNQVNSVQDISGFASSGTPLAATVANVSGAFFDLQAGVHFPANAKKLRFLCAGGVTNGSGTVTFNTPEQGAVYAVGDNTNIYYSEPGFRLTGSFSPQVTLPVAAGPDNMYQVFEIPVPDFYPGGAGSSNYTFRFAWMYQASGGTPTFSSFNLYVLGYEL